MYIYYILRGRRQGKLVEYEEDIDAERFPDVDLDDGPAIINHLVQTLNSEMGETDHWEECDLTDSFFNREDYLRTLQRSLDAPLRHTLAQRSKQLGERGVDDRWNGSSAMRAEPLLKAIILVSTCTYSGEEVLRQWCQYCLLARRRRSPPIDERLRKLHKPIDISEIARQTNRNAQCALLLIIDDVEKLLIGHARFLSETGGQILTHKAEGNLAYPRIAKTAAAHREPTLVGFLLQSIAIKQQLQ